MLQDYIPGGGKMKSDEIKHDEIVPVYTLRYDRRKSLRNVVDQIVQDTRNFPVRITLPENEISDVGIRLIKEKVDKYVATSSVKRRLFNFEWEHFLSEYGGYPTCKFEIKK